MKIELKGLDAEIIKETLDNGLTVYMMPYENKNSYSIHYVTRFGSVDTTFNKIDSEEEITVPDGIAHFLEHKMFESEDGEDPFTFASFSGANCNASTYYKYTRYLFEGNKDVYKNLDYLLKYVNSPYFTDENVEKEKGIIEEELIQYKDIIDFVMDNAVKENVFVRDNTRIDIGGTVESIRKITKEDLYDTYNVFYQPSNMFLVIVGSFDPDKAIEVIKNNKELNSRVTNKKISVKKIDEPLEVKNKLFKMTFNTENTKVAYSVKIPLKGIQDRYKYVTYFGLMLSAVFGLSSDFREEMRNRDLMSVFNYSREYSKDYMIITFQASSSKPLELVEEIKKTLKNIDIKSEAIERIKKVWISSEIMMVDDIYVTLDNIVYDIIEFGDIVPNKIDIYRSLNLDELLSITKSVDYSEGSTVIIEAKKS